MWWECSECGGHVERARAPAHCPECGIAGGIFVPAEAGDPIGGAPEADGLCAAWLKAGLDRARETLAA
jgi:hypothetical protein